MAFPWAKLCVTSFVFLEEKGKDERGGKRGKISPVKVKPCCGAGDVPRMPCVLPRVHSFSPQMLTVTVLSLGTLGRGAGGLV